MALLSDYTAGTVTVLAGGTAVTGVGTAWLTAQFQEGDEFIAPGWHGIIQSVNSNTSLTLYPTGIRGAALTGSTYRLRYQGDGSRLTAQARQLIQMLSGNGNLEALGGLGGAANTFPIFTGAGTMDVAVLTAFFRGLMDATDGPNLYGQIGTIPDAQLSARLGIGGTGPTDLNTITENGWYISSLSAANAPIAGVRALVMHQRYSSTLYIQTAWLWGASRQFYRTYNDGVWTGWQLCGLPILGTVSQSAGSPTGAIIERGGNANGEYVRFADGTQICSAIIDDTAAAWSTAAGALFTRSSFLTVNFPASFAATPVVTASANYSTSLPVFGVGVRNVATNAANVIPWSVVSLAAGLAKGLQVQAVGRWF